MYKPPKRWLWVHGIHKFDGDKKTGFGFAAYYSVQKVRRERKDGDAYVMKDGDATGTCMRVWLRARNE